MKKSMIETICCPNCKQRLHLNHCKTNGEEIIEGELRCMSCQYSYDILDGVPRMLIDIGKRKKISEGYGFTWAKRAENKFERETLYGKTESEDFTFFCESFDIKPHDLCGKKVLDAGCGCGRLTRMLGSYCKETIGVDISSTISNVSEYCKFQENVLIIQADILKLPFHKNYFDYVWCNGVISYTGKSEEAFRRLGQLVKPSGKLFVRVFSASRPSAIERLKKILWFSHRIPKDLLFYLCYLIAVPWSLCKYVSQKRDWSLRINAFVIFDTLAHPFTCHKEKEVESWFKQEGFSLIKSSDDGGVSVCGVKNRISNSG